jgi:signal transduction histidine kinase/ActR/RegA family two-component response regulator
LTATPPAQIDLAPVVLQSALPFPGVQADPMGMHRLLGLALAATAMAGLLLAAHLVIPGHAALIAVFAVADLLALAAILGLAIRQLRAAPATAAPQIEELARAKQAAEAANLAKSRYLASVSHEIRSPLNAIYGYAQLFERGDGANAQEAARVILRCSEHLTNLVEGLLDISQLEFGVLRVRTEEVRLPQFLEQIVSMMRPAAASKGLDFRYEASPLLPEFVRLDQSRFRQVLINLLSNAIKFTDKGSVTLKVGYSGQIATFEVRDTGPGIAPEDQERIFERFEQGPVPEGERAKPGAGLGLAIARTIVEILGGQLRLESARGAGATFRISMMMSEVAGKVATQAPERHILGYEGRPRTVLLVEDDADQRLFLEQLLRSLGFSAHVYPNGEAALADAQVQPDLAILDISLPGISGWEVATGLRQRCGADIKILMLSANSDELHRPDYDKPEHDRFLVKPVEFESLVETIGQLLGLTWRREAEPAQQNVKIAALPGCVDCEGPAQAHLVRLREFLRIGYVRGIEAEIKLLEQAVPEAAPLVRRLYEHLDRYDLAGMARLLQNG